MQDWPIAAQRLNQEMQGCYKWALKSLADNILTFFTWTHSGGVKLTRNLEKLLEEVDLSIPLEEHTIALHQEINYTSTMP